MKDLSELLNDANINVDDYEEMEVTELEVKKVKNSLKKLMKKKRNGWKKKAFSAAAAAVIATTILGFSFPTYASNIPIVGDIFRAIDGDRFANFQAFSNEIGITKTNNGISITINEAIFDGETVFFTYTIESDKDLGEKISLDAFTSAKEIKFNGSWQQGNEIERVAENQYVGVGWLASPDLNDPTVDVDWNIYRILNGDGEKVADGKWHFDFSVGATNNEELSINKKSSDDGAEALVDKVFFSPVSMRVYYENKFPISKEWDDTRIEWIVRDDLGNEYPTLIEWLSAWTVRDDLGNEYPTLEDAGWSGEIFENGWIALEAVHPDATKIIITPQVFLYKHKRPAAPAAESVRFLEDIIIELQ